MSQDEFFAFMPLLIYGIAISELMMHWRDYLKQGRRYWPHIITGVILLELAFVNFYYLYDKLDQLFLDYPHFLLHILPPLIFLLMVSVYTPEDDKDVKEYFLDKTPLIFSLLALFILINTLNDFDWNMINFIRVFAISVCVLIAISRKIWLIWFFIVARVFLFVMVNYFPHLLL